MEQVVEFFRVHVLDQMLDLAVVAPIVWIVPRVRLAPVLAHERAELSDKTSPPLTHRLHDRMCFANPQVARN